jgi:hypothetical protein
MLGFMLRLHQQVCSSRRCTYLLHQTLANLQLVSKSILRSHGCEPACFPRYRMLKRSRPHVRSPCKGLALAIAALHIIPPLLRLATAAARPPSSPGGASGAKSRLPPATKGLQHRAPPHSFAAASSCRFSMFFHESGLPWICTATYALVTTSRLPLKQRCKRSCDIGMNPDAAQQPLRHGS